MDSDMMMRKNESPERDRGRERERSRRGDRPSRFSSNTRDRSPVRERRSKPNDRKVYVSNVAYESKWQDIKDLFRSEVGEVSYVELFNDDNDKPRGCGIVEFETAEMAAKAVEKMHRYDLKGRKLVVKEASSVKDPDIDRDKYGRQGGGGGGGGGGRSGGGRSESNSTSRRDDTPRSNTWDGNNQISTMNSNSTSVGPAGGNTGGNSKFGNTYGLSPSFLENLWINGPLVTKVFVANLDYKVDEKKLREVFKLAGRVVHAEISMDKEGKSRGFGVVEYDHPVEAVQAISLLHNQMLFERRLTVRMDRVDKVDGPPKLPEGLKSIGMGLGVNGTILNDVSRNLPSTNSATSVQISNVQQLQAAAAAAAAAQAQVQLAQGAHLGQASLNPVNQGPLAVHLAGTNTLAPNLSSVLGPAINVSDLPNFGGSNQSMAGTGIPGISSLTAGLGVGGSGGMNSNFNSMNNQNSMMGNSNSYNNSGSGLHSPGSRFGQTRDFDSMSAALSGNNSGVYGFDKDNFRGPRDSNYNNSPYRPVGNGTNISSRIIRVQNLPPNATRQQLFEKFRDMGEICNIELISKDCGVIQFNTDREAERAVGILDRTRYEGRTIDVRLYCP